MKDKVFLHTKEDVSIIVKKYIICLLPLIIYGIYKNGFLLYSRNLIPFFEIFKIVYLLLISLGIYLIINNLILKKSFYSLDLVFMLIIPLFMPQNINIIIYTLGLFLSFLLASLLEKKIKFNKMAFCKLFETSNLESSRANIPMLVFSLILFWFCLKLPRNSFLSFVRSFVYYACPIYLYIKIMSNRYLAKY